jgi:hypothetical protein
MVDQNQHTAKAITHIRVCQVVKASCVQRSGWNMSWVESINLMWSSLCSSTHDAALTEIFDIVADSFPQESFECFGKKAYNSYVTY